MTYNGGLTREQFLFYETRTVARLMLEGCTLEDVICCVHKENLFQFPTERMISSIAKTCYRRLGSMNSEELVYLLANATSSVGKQINLYAMMKDNRVVWDFMTTVIGEKFRTQEFDFAKRDLNLFFFRLQEQDDGVASWSESTVTKIKQVLIKSLVECDYLDSHRSAVLNAVSIVPELEDGIRANRDFAALAAFNCFR